MADGDLRNDIDALRADLSNLRADLSRIADTVKTGTADTVRQRYEELERSLREQLRDVIDAARTRGQRSVSGVEQHVEEKPFLSILVAFAIGLLISQFLGRR
jgi:ElaB/YqjD/DUF883 family membrane-anchored ribosome-binding protein